jgi:YHS domain-containing protein
MKHLKQIAAALSVLLIMSVSLYADDVKQETKMETPKELKNQTLCPVMGGKIDSTSYTDIQGQRVYQCCPMCSKSLKADPDKYFKKAAEEGVLFENIQTTCPVSGVELEEKSIFTDFEGRRIYFCCNNCRGIFGDDPGKYLSTMDAPVKDDKKEDAPVKNNKKDDKHQSHH